ncbi:uncharacterized protein FTJAE_5885 [Fusarium tjaetaba]|uniref:Uncharacterized protein n=1 Tax=Fusarium tjaetaba TaxID=1567544 RepID=A0A8H5RPE6_9HYPO|nr:uncharacterized protein FTJAE_5885 [Fusarium tjaetaba]KAF5636690.1 hypothetical protein FTJAE_5885 [Fusarium tjaetaba]
MPAPPRPSRGVPPTFSKQDDDLWKAYAKALQTKFFGNLDTKIEIFYAAPIGEITNKGVYDIGDVVMQLDAPVFNAVSSKYSQRLQRALGSVRLNMNPDKGAQLRLQSIRSKIDKINEQYAQVTKKAMEAYEADEDKGSQTFTYWVQRSYPSFDSLAAERQSAIATEAALRSQIDGPGGVQLNDQRQKLLNALDLESDYPGLNMPCTPSFGNIVNGSSDLPREIGRTYNPLCKISYVQDGNYKEESIMAQDVGSELSAQLSAAQAGVFTVKPGEWDVPNITEVYPNFQREVAREIGPVAKVDQIILAYKVVMKLSLPANLTERVNNLTQKAKSAGGSVSFFGFEVGFGGGSKDEISISGSSIEIRKDLGYPVLLGVKGKKLPGLAR